MAPRPGATADRLHVPEVLPLRGHDRRREPEVLCRGVRPPPRSSPPARVRAEHGRPRGTRERAHRNLSVGWRQRLALGAATIHEPELLFLDEPTSGVDPVARRQFWDLLYDLASRGVTLFVTTHYMDEAAHCNRLAFIYRGRIIAEGSPAEMRPKPLTQRISNIACATRTGRCAGSRRPRRRRGLPVGAAVHAVVGRDANPGAEGCATARGRRFRRSRRVGWIRPSRTCSSIS